MQPKPVFFWRPEEKPYGVFSQWHPANMVDADGVAYPTAEHYMMYHKALLFNDQAMAEKILHLSSPRDVRSAGRKIQGFSDAVWDENKFRIVCDASLLKFTQHSALNALLQETEDRLIVEASPSDKIWGVGFSAKDALANKSRWGQNLLGKALMAVRGDLPSNGL